MRDIGKKLIVAAGSAVLAAAAAELAVRVAFDPPPRVNATSVPDTIRKRANFPGGRFVLRPGAVVVHEYPGDPRGYFDSGASLTYRINSLGFRGPETTIAKPEGVFRILGLGDSFTFGIGVRQEDTFLAVLGKRLGPPVEVLNMGVLAYDTKREVALLRHVGLDYAPDIVVICFFLNDAKGGGTLELINVEPQPEDSSFLVRHSALLERIRWVIKQRRQVSQLVKSYRKSFQPGAEVWLAQQRALEEAQAMSESEDFALVLMIFPVLWHLSDDYPFAGIHETVASSARALGIPVLDLLPEFEGHDGPELWVHPTDQHPNEIAHAIVGNALYRFLSDRALVPAR